MKPEDFIAKVKSCKTSCLQTGSTGWNFFPAKVNPERTRWKLSCETEQTRFKAKEKKTVIVEFFKEQNLSVFEAEMMLMVFGCGMRPIDYGGFSSSIHGRNFMENIKSITFEDVNDLLEEFYQVQLEQKERLRKIKEMKEKEVVIK